MRGKVSDMEQFSFLNKQLAGMLEAGIPLEGALENLVRDMRKGTLRKSLDQIQKRLQEGESFSHILTDMKDILPALYVKLCAVGEKSGKLPLVLNRLSSYYRWMGKLKGRLQTLMFYPLIVLIISMVLSIFLFFLFREFSTGWGETFSGNSFFPFYYIGLATMPMILLYLAGLYTHRLRFLTDVLSWRLSVTKYLKLANFSYMFHILLDSEVPLSESLSLMKDLSDNRLTKRALERMNEKVSEGNSLVEAMESEGIFPPAYTWVLRSSGEKLPDGFHQAGEIYATRAKTYMDIWIYAAMPVAVIFVAFFVWSNFHALFRTLLEFFTYLF